MKGEELVYDFGYGKADAYRWVNADGRSGGIVAASATVADTAFIGPDASIGPGAIIGDGASIGDKACIGYRASIAAGVSIGAYAAIGAVASIGDMTCIGHRATIGGGSSIGAFASVGDRAVIGAYARIGDRAVIEAADWHMAGGPCGSRDAMWTAVHSLEHGLRWWIGCQRGISTDALLERVRAKHGDNDHARAYRHAVRYVTTHPEYLRRVAAQAE